MSRKKPPKQKKPRKVEPDDDESFAMRAVNAEIDEAMGIENPDYDWLVGQFK